MENLTDEQKNEIQVKKMFDIAEKPIMEYICYYLKVKPDELFTEGIALPTLSDSLVLYPIHDYSENYLSFSLEMNEHDTPCSLPQQLFQYQEVHESLEFINYSIQQVFATVMNEVIKEDMFQNVMTNSFHLEFDDSNCSFKPVFVYPVRRQHKMFLQFKHDLNIIKEVAEDGKIPWDSLAEETKADWEERSAQLEHLLEHSVYDETEADLKEVEMNDIINKLHRICITFKQVTVEEITEKFQIDAVQQQLQSLELDDPKQVLGTDVQEPVILERLDNLKDYDDDEVNVEELQSDDEVFQELQDAIEIGGRN